MSHASRHLLTPPFFHPHDGPSRTRYQPTVLTTAMASSRAHPHPGRARCARPGNPTESLDRHLLILQVQVDPLRSMRIELLLLHSPSCRLVARQLPCLPPPSMPGTSPYPQQLATRPPKYIASCESKCHTNAQRVRASNLLVRFDEKVRVFSFTIPSTMVHFYSSFIPITLPIDLPRARDPSALVPDTIFRTDRTTGSLVRFLFLSVPITPDDRFARLNCDGACPSLHLFSSAFFLRYFCPFAPQITDSFVIYWDY